MRRVLPFIIKIVFGLIAVLVILYLVSTVPKTASNDRNWAKDQAILPEVTFQGDIVAIKNIRNFTYESTATYTPAYYDKTFDLNGLTSLDFIVEPFKDPGAAHTMLSFGFEDGSYLSISVEIRKEIGESFSPVKGILREYELTYVIADERDVVKLRSNYRKDTVYLYPVSATRESIRTLFVDMLTRAESLRKNPEFYDTLTNNCIINIVDHVNGLALSKVPWDYRFIFPANVDVYAHELGLIAPGMTLEEARATYRINERAEKYADDPKFSNRIREEV